MTQLAQRLGFDLADAFAGYGERLRARTISGTKNTCLLHCDIGHILPAMIDATIVSREEATDYSPGLKPWVKVKSGNKP